MSKPSGALRKLQGLSEEWLAQIGGLDRSYMGAVDQAFGVEMHVLFLFEEGAQP